MFNAIISKYINSLTIADIENFAIKQGICLKKHESAIIFTEIKEHFEDVVYHTDEELNKIKDKLEPTTYLKIKELIKFYKEKYPDYLNYL